jgi:hypothetical protein
MHRSAPSRAAWAVPVLLVALAGCGGEDPTPAASGTASASAQATEQASEQVTGEADAATGEPAGSEEQAEGAGTGDVLDEATIVPAMKAAVADQQTARFTMRTGAGAQSFTAEGDIAFRGTKPELALTMDGAAMGMGTIEMRLVDEVMYLSMPPVTPRGKFVEVTGDDEGSPFAGMMAGMSGVDPRTTFAAFEAGLRKVSYVGTEPVDGEQLDHYRLTVDVASAAKAQKMPTTTGMPENVVYDLWLDDEALMRRVEHTMTQDVSLVMEMSGWGEPVTIEAPRRADIVEDPAQ